jgi:hypothetical protein
MPSIRRFEHAVRVAPGIADALGTELELPQCQDAPVDTGVFIGHGRSLIWRELEALTRAAAPSDRDR